MERRHWPRQQDCSALNYAYFCLGHCMWPVKMMRDLLSKNRTFSVRSYLNLDASKGLECTS